MGTTIVKNLECAKRPIAQKLLLSISLAFLCEFLARYN